MGATTLAINDICKDEVAHAYDIALEVGPSYRKRLKKSFGTVIRVVTRSPMITFGKSPIIRTSL